MIRLYHDSNVFIEHIDLTRINVERILGKTPISTPIRNRQNRIK